MTVASWGYGELGRGGRSITYIVNHVAEGTNSLYGWFYGKELSTHYWVSKSGVIERYVPDTGTAYGQGIVVAGSDFPPGYPGSGQEYNRMCLSIEREGSHTDEPSTIQWQRIVALNKYLAAKYGVPVDANHIIGHYRSDNVGRDFCPSSPSMPAAAYMAALIAAIQAG